MIYKDFIFIHIPKTGGSSIRSSLDLHYKLIHNASENNFKKLGCENKKFENYNFLNYSFKDRREGDIEEIYSDVKKSKNILEWESKKTLDEMMSSAWKWQKNL